MVINGIPAEKLFQEACEARKMAYTPYSHFAVGAALLCADGTIIRGCNVENAAYSPTNCAERTAVFSAVSQGHRSFSAIAIAGGPQGSRPEAFCPPCGVCRQVLMEFVDPETFSVVLGDGTGDIRICTLKELLPMGFGPANLA